MTCPTGNSAFYFLSVLNGKKTQSSARGQSLNAYHLKRVRCLYQNKLYWQGSQREKDEKFLEHRKLHSLFCFPSIRFYLRRSEIETYTCTVEHINLLIVTRKCMTQRVGRNAVSLLLCTENTRALDVYIYVLKVVEVFFCVRVTCRLRFAIDKKPSHYTISI